jgi:hypothetical protein
MSDTVTARPRHTIVRTLALIAATLPTLAAAEGDQISQLQEQVKALSKKVEQLTADKVTTTDIDTVRDDLQVFKDQYGQDREKRSPVSARGITISGIIQGRWAGTTVENANGVTNTSFDVPLAQIGLSGNLYRDYKEGRNLSFNLSLSSVRPASLINYYSLPVTGVGSTTGANTNVALSNAWVRYNVLPTVDGAENQLRVTLGQQLVPFGVEAAAAEEVKPTIRGAQGISYLGLTTRQIGVIVEGDVWPAVDYAYDYRAPAISYAFGIINGNGANAGDDNPNKDLFGRLAFAAPVDYYSIFRGLSVGVSVLRGKANVVTPVGAVPVGTGDSNRYGFDVTYAHNPFSVTYEYVAGVTDTVTAGNSAATAKYDTIRAVGQQVTLGYLFGEQFVNSSKSAGKWDDSWPISWQPYVRYDGLDKNSAEQVDDDRTAIFSLGLNVFFAQTTKFQIQASRIKTEQVGTGGDSYNELVTQFQYGF